MKPIQIYLVSKSPRRRELLAQIGIRYQVLPADVDETIANGEAPSQAVQRLALKKAEAVWQHPSRQLDLPVLGADTIVCLKNRILGKPRDAEEAISMLQLLSGQTHQVLSAIAVMQGEQQEVTLSTSSVTFRIIDYPEMKAYWDSGEPKDKAGAYGIQGTGAVFIKWLEGSYSGVMGLPLFETHGLLTKFGIYSGPNQQMV